MASTEVRVQLVFDTGPAIAQLERLLAAMRALSLESAKAAESLKALDLTDDEPVDPSEWENPGVTESGKAKP